MLRNKGIEAKMIDERKMINPLELMIKFPYKIEKMMKKLYGKKLAREIAMGRNIIKMMQKNYENKNE